MSLLISRFNLYFCLCGKLFNSAASSFPKISSSLSCLSWFMLVNILFKTFDVSLITSSAPWFLLDLLFSMTLISVWSRPVYLLHFFDRADSSSIVNDSCYNHSMELSILTFVNAITIVFRFILSSRTFVYFPMCFRYICFDFPRTNERIKPA